MNCTIHERASTVITACKSRLNTNRTKILQITFTTKEISKIINLSLIFPSPANSQKFNQLKQLNIRQGHNICNNSHENLNFSPYNNTDISCQNTKKIHHTKIDNSDKYVYIRHSISLNLSFSFLVDNSVVIGNTNEDNGQTTKVNVVSSDNIFVKYHDDSDHNLFTTNCWSIFHNKVPIFTVKNTQKAYFNCVEIIFLFIGSLGNLNRLLYFLKIWINHIDIHIATPIIHANANNETSKLTETRKIMENIKAENNLENSINPTLNVSWNEPKIVLQTCIKLVHKK